MIERFSYDPFVLPYTIGLVFILTYLFIATSRVLAELPLADRTRLRKHILSKDIFKTFKDIFLDCFIHTKIWKRNRWLGYMHMSIALGWFMLIVIGHFEVQIFCPHRINLPYFPIFFRYFVMEANLTLKGSLFFFLMDLFLLMVLSGVGLAIYKRFRKQRFGMRRTTKLRLPDQIAMYSLWCIFPLRLMAESFTAGITKDGSFLTRGFGLIFENFVQNEAYIRPIWWGYSCALAMFFFTLPWSRYMHIVSEFLLIPMRNAGIRESRKNKGYARVELYSCSRCGICIDACQLSSVTNMQPKTTVYFLRELRDKDVEASKEIASYCMQCRRCVEACPVEIDSCELKLMQKQNAALFTENQFDYLDKQKPETRNSKPETLYFAGCMTHLTPAIKKSMVNILEKSGENYQFWDENGSVCCGRPMLLAGQEQSAQALIEKQRQQIIDSGAKTFVTSCPICYKMFNEKYNLPIRVLHHSQYINELIEQGKIKVEKSDLKVVFHDPCELGRSSGVYEEPRKILQQTTLLQSTSFDGKDALCCGNSIATETLPFDRRKKIAKDAVQKMSIGNPDYIVTACPLCKKTFSDVNETPVMDLAQVVEKVML